MTKFPSIPIKKESMYRVRCQWMTVGKWSLRVPALREKILSRPFRRHGCLHTHDVRARDRFRSFYKAWVPPHPRRTARKSSTMRVWVCSHPPRTEGFIQLCCLFTLMFIHPNKQFWWAQVSILRWQSQNFITLLHKLLELRGNNHKCGWFLTHNVRRR